MIARYRVLVDRIGHELTLLSESVQRCESAVERVRQNPVDKDFYVALLPSICTAFTMA